MGRYWENSGPRPPWGGWVTGGRPRGRTSVPGEVAWWLGWPCGDSDGNSPAMPPVGRVKNAKKTTAGAPGQAGRSGRTNPQLRAARGAAPKRARMLIAARASRGPRATSREIPESGERRNPHPQQQQGRPHLRADVRTRDVACAMTRSVAAARGACALIRQTDVTRTARQDAQREGSGGTASNTACVRACVRTCVRADLRT